MFRTSSLGKTADENFRLELIMGKHLTLTDCFSCLYPLPPRFTLHFLRYPSSLYLFPVCLYACMSVHLSIRLFVCPSVFLSVCQSTSVRPSVRTSACLCLSVCPSVRPCPSVCPSLFVRPSVCLCACVCLSVCLFICLSLYVCLPWKRPCPRPPQRRSTPRCSAS
jgi:hypothetical protein